MSNNNLTESIFEAVDILVQSAIDKIKYDQTIVCTITDISNAKEQNYYLVSDGSIEFKAFSENTEYKKGDQVRVSIPNGNFDDDKYIVGKYIVDENHQVKYSLPTEKILKVIELKSEMEEVSLVANKNEDIPFIFDVSDNSYFENNIYDVFYIEFDVRTDFQGSKILGGNYGIQIEILDKYNHSTSFEMDSSKFFGNSFSYIIATHQAEVFSVVDISEIKSIKIKPYQKNNFIDQDGENFVSQLDMPNIYFTNIEFGLGFNLAGLPDNSIKLFSTDSLNFVHTNPSSSNNKTVGLLWCNKNEQDGFIGFNDGVGKIIQKTEFLDNFDTFLQESGVITSIDEQDSTKTVYDFSKFDEIGYQKEIAKINELNAQKSNNKLDDEPTLRFSLQIERIHDQLSKLYVYLNDIAKSLYDLRVNFTGKTRIQNLIDIELKSVNDKSTVISRYLTGNESSSSLKNYCNDILKYIYETKNEVEEPTIILENLKSPINNFETDINVSGLLDWTKLNDEINSSYQEFKSLYERKRNSINELLNKAIELKDSIKSFSIVSENGVFTLTYWNEKLNSQQSQTFNEDYWEGETYNSYTSPDLSFFSNLYSIYWYRQEEGYKNEDDPYLKENWINLKDSYIVLEDCNLEAEEGKTVNFYKNEILSNLTQETNFVLQIDKDRDGSNETYTFETMPVQPFPKNLGLPLILDQNLTSLTYRQTYNFDKLAENNNNIFSCFLNPDKTEEKFKVIIVHNHQYYESNELVFKNEENFQDEIQGADTLLTIAHGTSSYKDYFLYDNTNYLANSAEELQRRILTAVYAGTDSLVNAEIFWYFPANSTMLNFNIEELEAANFAPVRSYKKIEKKEQDRKLYTYSEQSNSFSELDSSYNFPLDQEFVILDNKKIGSGSSAITYVKILYDYDNNEIDEEVWIKNENDFETQPLLKNPNDDYIVFNKVIETEDEALNFPYYIKNYYVETATNNTIKCKIVISDTKKSENEEVFSFGYLSSNGTNYKLIVQPENPLTQRAASPHEPFVLRVYLLDTNNKIVPLAENSVFASWIGPSSYSIGDSSTISMSKVGEEYRITIDQTPNPSETVKIFYGILKITTSIETEATEQRLETGEDGSPIISEIQSTRQVNLETYYSIPWSSELNYYIEGADKIVYNSLGIDPKYYQGSYELYSLSLNEENEQNNVPETLTWSMNYLTSDGEIKILENGENLGLPRLMTTEEGKHIIEPWSMYINDLDIYPFVQCESNKTLLWVQPILITQNRYESNILNDWSGQSISIDQEKATILASMLGAGKKEEDNTFSGVVMGNVQATTGLNIENETAEGPKTGLGIYGLHHGSQSFGFNVDGTAFLGKSGKGRIYFDGNYGVIKSGAWDGKIDETGNITETGTGGMAIALETGQIAAYNFKLTSENISLNSNPNDGGYYLMIGDETKNHISFSKDDELSIRAKKFELSSGIWGETNLLSNTEPFEERGKKIERNWEKLSENLFSNKKDGYSGLQFLRDSSFGNIDTKKIFLKQQLVTKLNETYYTISGKYYFSPVEIVEVKGLTKQESGHDYYFQLDYNLYPIDKKITFVKDGEDEKVYVNTDVYALIDNYEEVTSETYSRDSEKKYALEKKYISFTFKGDNESDLARKLKEIDTDEAKEKYWLGVPEYVVDSADDTTPGRQYYTVAIEDGVSYYIPCEIPNRGTANDLATAKTTFNNIEFYYISEFNYYAYQGQQDDKLMFKSISSEGAEEGDAISISLIKNWNYRIQVPESLWYYQDFYPHEETFEEEILKIDSFTYDQIIFEYDGYVKINTKTEAQREDKSYYSVYFYFDNTYIQILENLFDNMFNDTSKKFEAQVYELEDTNFSLVYQISLQTNATKYSHKDYYYQYIENNEEKYRQIPSELDFDYTEENGLIIKQYEIYRKTEDGIYVNTLPEDASDWTGIKKYIYLENEENFKLLTLDDLPLVQEEAVQEGDTEKWKIDIVQVYDKQIPRIKFTLNDETASKDGFIYLKKAKEWINFSYTFNDCNFDPTTFKYFSAQLYNYGYGTNMVEGTDNYYILLSQLKLESGTMATPWDKSSEDMDYEEDRRTSTISDFNSYFNRLEKDFNTQFSQEKMFAELSNGYKNQGLFLDKGLLFINATQIATGAIKSQNWATSGGAIDDYGNILARGNAGMAISLTDGHIDAYNFKLTAGDVNSFKNGALILDSNPEEDNDPYLYIGNDINYMNFQKDGDLVIRAKDLMFTTTFTGDNLLSNTAPEESLGNIIESATSDEFNAWRFSDLNVLSAEALSGGLGRRKCLTVINSTTNPKSFSQTIKNPKEQYYSLSGQVLLKYLEADSSNSDKILINYIYNEDQSQFQIWEYPEISDTQFESYIFDKNETGSYFECKGGYYQISNGYGTKYAKTSANTYVTVPNDIANPMTINSETCYGLINTFDNKLYKKTSENPLTYKVATSTDLTNGGLILYYKTSDTNYKEFGLGKEFTIVESNNVQIKSQILYVKPQYKITKDTNFNEKKRYYVFCNGSYVNINIIKYKNFVIGNKFKYASRIAYADTSTSTLPLTVGTLIRDLSLTGCTAIEEDCSLSQNNLWYDFNLVFDGSNAKELENLTFNVAFGAAIATTTPYCIYFHKLKLAPGKNKTDWTRSEVDISKQREMVESIKDNLLSDLNSLENELSTSLTHEKIFAELSNGYQDCGIISKNGLLFINANQIATGVIKSQNWALGQKGDGTDGGVIDDYGRIIKRGNAGMAISLTTGEIDAHNFKLTGGDTLLLNSHPGEGEDYFRVGNSYNIQLTSGGFLNINAAEFSLNAFKDTSFLQINSSPIGDQYYLNVGNSNEYMRFKSKLEVKGKIVATELDIGGDVNGLYTNDLEDQDSIFFKSYITQTEKTNEQGLPYVETVVSMNDGREFKYSAYETDSYLVLGRGTDPNKDNIYIGKDGLLRAHNAIIWGTIYATDGIFTGRIEAQEGYIGVDSSGNGGFIINEQSLTHHVNINDSNTRITPLSTFQQYFSYYPGGFSIDGEKNSGPNPFHINYGRFAPVTPVTDAVWPSWHIQVIKETSGDKAVLEYVGDSHLLRFASSKAFKDIILDRVKKEIKSTIKLTCNSQGIESGETRKVTPYVASVFGPGHISFNCDNSFLTEMSAGSIVFEDRSGYHESKNQASEAYRNKKEIKKYEITTYDGILRISGVITGLAPQGYGFANNERDILKGRNNLGVVIQDSGFVEFICIGNSRQYSAVSIAGQVTLDNASALSLSSMDYQTTSDERLKTNINQLSNVSTFNLGRRALTQTVDYGAFFDSLIPVSYNYRESEDVLHPEKVHYGLIAQQVIDSMTKNGLPVETSGLISIQKKNGEEYYNISYNNFIALLINEVQKLKQEVSILKETLNQE